MELGQECSAEEDDSGGIHVPGVGFGVESPVAVLAQP